MAMASTAALFTPVTLVSRPALSNQRVVAPQTRRCKIPIVSASVSAQPFVAVPDDLVASILSKVRFNDYYLQYKVVEAPDIVRNKVCFSAFGFLDGEVSLKAVSRVSMQSFCL
ncbi:hypothetical protein B296_00049512, partial [Ensete ventricosum]